jgi:hypothetical protein
VRTKGKAPAKKKPTPVKAKSKANGKGTAKKKPALKVAKVKAKGPAKKLLAKKAAPKKAVATKPAAKPKQAVAKAAPKPAKAPAPAKVLGTAPPGFVPAGKGYALGLKGQKLVCLNAKGQALGSVPKDMRESDVGEQLLAAVDFLKAHERDVTETVEGWMLRSLPTPAAVLSAVWVDETYRKALENLAVARVSQGEVSLDSAGFLKGVDASKGIGLVDLDGETVWEKADAFLLPHPILLSQLEDFRALAAELSLTQGVKQLFREVFELPKDVKADQTEISTFRGGKFEMLAHARGAAKSLGYRTSGGWATCQVFENGKTYEARFWLGADDGDGEALTDGLMWVDEKGESVLVKDVPKVAFSEGMRMASAIYGKRVVEKKEEDDDA